MRIMLATIFALTFSLTSALAQPSPPPDPWVNNGNSVSYLIGTVIVGVPSGSAVTAAGNINIAGNYYVNGVAAATTVNGQTCALSGTCTISASATQITYGATTMNGGTGVPYNTISGGNMTAAALAASSVMVTNGSSIPSFSTTLPSGISATDMTLTTPSIGVASGTSLAIGGGAIGSNALAVTGTTLLSGALTYGGVTLSNSVVGTGPMVLGTAPSISSPTITGGSGAFTGGLSYTLAQNASTVVSAINSTSGTTALAAFQVTNDLGLATFGAASTAYTGFTGLATKAFVYSTSALGGIALYADGAAHPITFVTNGTEAARALTGFMVGTTTDPGAGIVNAATGYRIANAAASNHILLGNGSNYVDSPTFPANGLSGLGASLQSSLPGGDINRFRNGTLDVWQRGTSALATSTPGAYTADGWLVAQPGAAFTCAQDTGNNGPSFSLKCVGGTSNTDTIFGQKIESYLASVLAGQTVTVQFQYKQTSGSAITPKISTCYASATDDFSTCTADLAATSVTSCASGSWCTESYTFTPSANASNDYYVKLDCNTALTAAQACWITAADIRSTPGVTTGINTSPPPPELRTVSYETTLCQRYLMAYNATTATSTYIAFGGALSATNSFVLYNLPTTMRVAPTGVTTSAVSGFLMTGPSGTPITTTSVTFSVATPNQVILFGVVSTGLTAGQTTALGSQSSSAQLLITGAEL